MKSTKRNYLPKPGPKEQESKERKKKSGPKERLLKEK